jgi:hexosaminidase
MRIKRSHIFTVIVPGISVFVLLSGSLLSAHNTLLPIPQEIRYGSGKLMIGGLEIRIDDDPAPEDRFAAAELAAWLAEVSGFSVRVVEGPTRAGARAVVLKRTGSIDALPVPGERGGPESREAYEIRITPQSAFITARSSAGLYWAAQTLRQMIEGRGAEAFLPEAEIRDWPALPYRGYMMDFSHAQLPTLAEVKRQIDFLARWKTNQYLFYSEASIELEGYPTLMAEARYTQAEVRDVIEYARTRHIDVIPNMELYGHLHDLFRMEKYSDLAVIPHGGEFNRRDPRIKPLLEDWIGQVARLFPSPFFHIGFDETWLLGREAARLKTDPGELYLGLLKEVAAIVERNGKSPLAYADMIQKFPQITAGLPRGLTAVAWHYFPLQEAEYDRLLGPLSSNGIPLILQSAVINWHWLVTDYDTSFRNIDVLAAAAKKHNALGLYQSGWTDDTQTLTKPGWPAWAYASIAGWRAEAPDRARFFSDYAALLYPSETAPEAALAFGALARAETLLQGATRRETIRAFFDDPFAKERLEKSSRESNTLRETRLAADEALANIIKVQRTGVDPDTFKSLEACVRMIDFAALKHIYAREIADFWDQLGPNPDPKNALNLIHNEVSYKYHTRTSDMMDALSVIKDRFREAWLAEFTPFRLNIALAKFDVELQTWWKLQRRLTSAVENLVPGLGLPSLDALTGDLWE